ncbi:MAG: DUF4236 domain-containing protein [Solobacterium sp.]|nr:DUF4236 domain-containing protein [Solobacterium sp.]
MGVRFRRSVKISKGVKVNFGKSGASVSFGTRGLHHTIHTSGRRTTSAGIPGTGLSYVSTSKGKKSRASGRQHRYDSITVDTQEAINLQQQKDAEYAQNCEMVDDYNELIDQIRSIHDECSDPIDWAAIKDKPEPFSLMSQGPFEREARNALDNEKPSIFGKFIPTVNKKRNQRLSDAVLEAQEKDLQMYNDWVNLKKLAIQVLSGDIDSYFYVMSEMHPFDEILDFGSDFDIGTDLPDILEVEFHAKTSKVVPNHVLFLTQNGKLSSKLMTKTMHYDIAQDYICSCVLRVARETFALLPVNKVLIHAVDTVSDDSGVSNDNTVLSVLIQRDQLEGIDFDTIDPSDTIESFDCNMNFKKTQGLKPVQRIEI